MGKEGTGISWKKEKVHSITYSVELGLYKEGQRNMEIGNAKIFGLDL